MSHFFASLMIHPRQDVGQMHDGVENVLGCRQPVVVAPVEGRGRGHILQPVDGHLALVVLKVLRLAPPVVPVEAL